MKELAVFVAAVVLIGWGLGRGESPATVGAQEKNVRRPAVEEAGEARSLQPEATRSDHNRGPKTMGNNHRETNAAVGRHLHRTRGYEPVEA